LGQAYALARQIALEKNGATPFKMKFASTHRDGLARSWDKALSRVPGHPPFGQVEKELVDGIESLNPAE
jgi:hypothetical protein